MIIYNLEYRVLDKLKRAKKVVHVGLYKSLEDVETAKEKISTSSSDKIAFDVYIIDDPFLNA